jgi:hypothetical protein
MNNQDLEKKLKGAPGPALESEYLEDFSRIVSAKIRSAPPRRRPPVAWLPRLAWSGGIALACLLVGFAVGHWRGRMEVASSGELLENTKLIRETLAMFPNQVRAIVQDDQGMRLVLSQEPDVPVSAPLFVRICDGKHCSSLVTFSGQEIQVAGQKLTVLSDANGGVIIVGNDFAWSSSEPFYAKSGLKIQAKSLGTIQM